MTRWILLGLTFVGFTVVFIAKSAGLLALGLLLGAVGAFGLVFALASERVAASARPDALMAAPEDLAALGKRPAPPRAAPPFAPERGPGSH